MRHQQIRVIGCGRKQRDVELVRLHCFSGVVQHLGQHMRNSLVAGVGGVQLLQERQRLGLVLGGQHRGQLSVQRLIVGRLLQRLAQKGFGFRILFARNQQVGQAGAGRRGARVLGQEAAVGLLGVVQLPCLAGEIRGQQRVGRRLR